MMIGEAVSPNVWLLRLDDNIFDWGIVLKDYSSRVNLADSINADSVAISKDRYFADAYVIDLPLDSVPNHIWQDIFEREWKSSRRLWDRKLYMMGDNLRLVTTKDNIEDKLDWVKQVIQRTNRFVDEYHRQDEARAKLEEGIRSQGVEEEKMSIDMIRNRIRRTFGSL
jgi:hypothetical protein